MDEFLFSESHIKKTNRLQIFVSVVALIFTTGLIMFFEKFNFKEAIIPLIVFYIIFGVIDTIQIPRMNKHFRKIKAQIYNDRIIKQSGKSQQIVYWDGINKVRFTRNVKNKLALIRIYRKDKKVIYLFGFNEMEKLSKLISEKIVERAPIETQKYKLNWEHPLFLIIGMCITIALIFTIIAVKSMKGMLIFVYLLSLLAGFYLLLFRPLTAINLGFKRSEMISGIFLIIIGFSGFIKLIFSSHIFFNFID